MKNNPNNKLSLNNIVKLIPDKFRKKSPNDLLGYSHEAYLKKFLHEIKAK